MKVEVDAVNLDRKKADDRGRVVIGADYADKEVTVAVVEVHDNE